MTFCGRKARLLARIQPGPRTGNASVPAVTTNYRRNQISTRGNKPQRRPRFDYRLASRERQAEMTCHMRISGIIFAAGLLTACAQMQPAFLPPPAAPTFVQTTAQIKRSVVPVVCVQPPQAGGTDYALVSMEGTAFFLLRDGTFATAGHVVRDLTNPARRVPCPVAAILIPENGWQSTTVSFGVQYFFFSQANCTRDEGLDIAICRAPKDIRQTMGSEPEPVILETALQEDGALAAFTGFPQTPVSFRVPVTSRGSIAAYGGTNDERGPRQLFLDKTTWPGASGSPIYLEDGRVVAILLARGTGDGAGITIGLPASFIARLLAQRRQAQQ